MSKMFAVHFLPEDMKAAMGYDAKPWKVGDTRSVKGPLELCANGYHYSPTWAAALKSGFLYGPMACIVEVDDDGPQDDTKGCSRTRTLIEVFNVEREMRLYAADEATRCLKAWEKSSGEAAHVDSWKAIKAARAFANGKITADDLSAAESAAWSAAEAAARSEAWSAAESAARSEAWSAAKSAAESAARSEADAAAEAAAWSAARSEADAAAADRFALAMHKATGWADVEGKR